MNKKGLSAVVATLLIVVITIAAVLLVWNVVKKNIESNAGQLSAADCVKVDINIDNCVAATKNGTISFSGSLVPTQLVLIAEQTTGSAVSQNLTTSSAVIGGKIVYTSTAATALTKVTIVPYVGTGANLIACTGNTEVATCA